MKILQNSQKFGVRVWKSYINHRSAGYVKQSSTCTRTRTRTRTREYFKGCTRAPGIVPRVYMTYESSGYGWERVPYRTHKSSGTGNAWENTPRMAVQNTTSLVWLIRLTSHTLDFFDSCLIQSHGPHFRHSIDSPPLDYIKPPTYYPLLQYIHPSSLYYRCRNKDRDRRLEVIKPPNRIRLLPYWRFCRTCMCLMSLTVFKNLERPLTPTVLVFILVVRILSRVLVLFMFIVPSLSIHTTYRQWSWVGG